MSLLSKILAGLYFLAALGLFYASARTLKTHVAWRGTTNEYQAKIDKAAERIRKSVHGDKDAETLNAQTSLVRLNKKLSSLISDTGRYWKDCTHSNIDPDTGAVTVTVGRPEIHNLKTDRLLYVFQQRDVDDRDGNPGKYVGEFKVAADPDSPKGELRLVPSQTLDAADLQRAQAAGDGDWIVYEAMPNDSHSLFRKSEQENWPREELARFVPEATLLEFLHDGQPPQPDHPPERVFVTVRLLQEWTYKRPKPRNAEGVVEFEDVQVPAGRRVEMPLPEAQALIAANVAEEVERRYVRPLRDYRTLQAEHGIYKAAFHDLMARIKTDNTSLDKAIATAKAQQAKIVDEIDRLKQEQTALEGESNLLAARVAQQEQTLARGKAEVARLLAENARLFAQLQKAQEEAVRRAEKTVAEAAAQ